MKAPDARAFHFAVLGDRTGGHRPGVFAAAVEAVNRLQPDFVIGVGDAIEGYTEDRAQIDAEWAEFEALVEKLDAPFVFAAGNHDVSNLAMAQAWAERRGSAYFAFTFDDVLFLVLSTEDPPVDLGPERLKRVQEFEAAFRADPAGVQARVLEAMRGRDQPVKLPGEVAISEAQLAFVGEALARTPAPRWTFVILHKPAWRYGAPAFHRIEEMLGDRPYTVIAGHEHYYDRETRRGREYITMATTGGVWLQDGPGRLDHLLWVAMTDAEPAVSVIDLGALYDSAGP